MHQNAHNTDTCFPNRNISVRKVVLEDQETLRTWRNDHSQRFFYREKIQPLHSSGSGFPTTSLGMRIHLFMVLVNALPTGCIGIRLLDDHWDLYNVMRGVHRLHSHGCMGTALHHVIEFALQRKVIPVQLKVLANNPACDWYKDNRFSVIKTEEDHIIMQYQTLSSGISKPHNTLMISVFGSDIGDQEIEAAVECLRSQWLGFGKKVDDFEKAFASHFNLANCLMVDSGSNALYMAVRLLDLAPDDEIIIPSFTWVSCAQAVLLAGHRPIFCDVDPITMNVRREDIEPCINSRTKAIMVVHYAGLPVTMQPILDLGYPVIEDAAHAVCCHS